MLRVKQQVFDNFKAVVDLKNEYFKTKSDRQSDTFTNTKGTIRIKLGNRLNEGWDDTVENGIDLVKEYIKSLANSDETAILVDTIMNLLSKDAKGSLKASKVLELKKLATKVNNEKFSEGIAIIEEAYKPVPTCQFIELEAKKAEDKGLEKVPLSLAAM